MYPILFSIGPVHIYSFSVFLILSWLVFSFLFWRYLRSQAVTEERIFDLTFYATLAAIVGGRVGFVLMHPELFEGDFLAMAALWVQPGLSLYGALLAGVGVFIAFARSYKVRLGHVLDAFGIAFPVSLLFGGIGSLLDGSEVGLAADLPWAVAYVGHVGRRHPVQAYELVALVAIIVIILLLSARAARRRWPYGILGIWFFLLFSPVMFSIEFFKESSVYFSLRANQWVQVFLFAEALGAFYVRGGGRESMRVGLGRAKLFIGDRIGALYGRISKRRSGNNQSTP